MASDLTSPGVYTGELNPFLDSTGVVATAIPAFIGYTPRDSCKGNSLTNKPMLIQSMSDYLSYFGVPEPRSTPESPRYLGAADQYSPQYSLVPTTGGPDVELDGKPFLLLPDPGTVYYLYNALRLFFLNGGGSAYICSVGTYGTPTGKPQPVGQRLVNPNVALDEIQEGLDAVGKEADVTILVIPDANLLGADDNATLMQRMIEQAQETGNRFAVLDVALGLNPDPVGWRQEIEAFRAQVGGNGLKNAAAYYPYLNTSVSAPGDVDYRNLGGATVLSQILPDAQNENVATVLRAMKAQSNPTPGQINQINLALQAESKDYALLYDALLKKVNVLPPSPAMAGIYVVVDAESGVWKAPANVNVESALSTTLNITDNDQQDLNEEAVTGKSINAIRLFQGRGVLVWGARTLDANSRDWRYLQVRRTVIMIEQSIKRVLNAFVFEPNDVNTWHAVSAMISRFLTMLWQSGGLLGDKPAEAFSVAVGLGTTMTSLDVLEGRMNISVQVALTHPAEFIIITLSQLMQKS